MTKQTFTTGQVLTAAQMTSLQQTAMGGGSTTAKTTSYVLVAADAGTVVQMNAAGATTITVNQSLFAAGDTVQIQNVGAGVCTVTAGTATVSTSATLALKQYDSGDLYFNTTSAAFFFSTDAADGGSPLTTKGDVYTFSTVDARLGVGANDTVLTADSAQATGLKWAAVASAAKAYTLVNSGGTSLTGTSVSITGLSSYDDLLIIVRGASCTAASQSMYMSVNSVTSANSYTRAGMVTSFGSSYSNAISTVANSSDTEIRLGTMSNNADSTVSGGVSISGCRGAGVKPLDVAFGSDVGSGTANAGAIVYKGVINATTAISSVQIFSGTFDAGTIFVYGAV